MRQRDSKALIQVSSQFVHIKINDIEKRLKESQRALDRGLALDKNNSIYDDSEGILSVDSKENTPSILMDPEHEKKRRQIKQNHRLVVTKNALQRKSQYLNKFKDTQRSSANIAMGNPSQQLSLISSQQTTQRWTETAQSLAEKTNKCPEETLMMRSCWDQRRKQEVSSLVDLTSSINDKYGNRQSFLLKLRIQDGDPQVVNYKLPVSSKWRDASFGALIKDDRQKKVELIREIPNIQGAYLSPKQIKSPSNLLRLPVENTRNNNAKLTQSSDLSHVSQTEYKSREEMQPTNPYNPKRPFSHHSSSKVLSKEERIRLSQCATSLYRGEYNLEQDPLVKQRLCSMSNGILNEN